MTKMINETATIKARDMGAAKDNHALFTKKIVRLNALAAAFKGDDSDMEKAEEESKIGLSALNANGAFQEMLAAQMLSIHHLQQVSMAMANQTTHMGARQSFANNGIKLANVFVQQANLLSRLQGSGGHRITVERVDVHQGGQAVVGSVIGVPPTTGSKT